MTAPTFTNLTANGASSATSFNTASVSPTGNRLILVSIHAYINTGSVQPSAPTVTGNGITYTLIGSGQDVDNVGTDRATMWIYRGMAASPSTGAISISFGATTMTRCFWSVDQSDANVDTSGTNGSGAIVTDPPVGVTVAAATGTSNITYSPAMTSGNSAFAAIAHQSNEQVTPRASWTELADTFPVTLGNIETQYFAGTDTAASGTWTTSARGAGIALEIKAAASGTTGTVAVTQSANTASASGILGYTGTVAATQANQTASASGQLGYTGTAGVTQAANTSSASGTVTSSGFTGSVAATQASQTSNASGVLGYSGTAVIVQAGNTAAASGILGYAGTFARAQANQTATASGGVANPITGTAVITQAAQVSTASGSTQPLVTFGTASAGIGARPTAQGATGAAPIAVAATAGMASASARTVTVPTATGG
jgi:hypothetical protein